MHPMSASESGREDRQALEQWLERFEDAWQSGLAPSIEAYLPHAGASFPRQELLEELIKIDVERRWRLKSAGGTPWLLEDYVARHPELGPVENLSIDLITEEYRARRRWGDRPGQDEYEKRFAPHAAALRPALREVDAELDATASCGPDPAAAQPVPAAVEALPLSDLELAIPPASPADLVELIRNSGLLRPIQFDELGKTLVHRWSSVKELVAELLRRDWLTPYQANHLLQGRGATLQIGAYLLLERLGQGGVGQVYKARHQRMNRVVALKVIRPELLSDPEVVGRFYREMEVVSKLQHPNVVHAFDAGPIGHESGVRSQQSGTSNQDPFLTADSWLLAPGIKGHFLAMEYVEGTDLNRLVKANGPLPVEQARDFIQQAARGLAHAHERGLVHRDIKPGNLLLSWTPGPSSLAKTRSVPSADEGPMTSGKRPIIKIADMGLARFHCTPCGDRNAPAGTVTPINAAMMGTPDYMAPEQAVDFHAADIRADIYSLGCTFHYLLTGSPPFGGATLAAKLLLHQNAEPPDVRHARPDVPAEMASVLRRMLAKRPEDRSQSPAEVVAALAGGSVAASTPPSPMAIPLPTPGRKAWRVAVGMIVAMVGVFLVLLFAGILPPEDDDGRAERPALLTAHEDIEPATTRGPTFVYQKKTTRDRTVLATLEANGWPTLEGRWYYIGPFNFPNLNAFYQVHPPERELDLGKQYDGKDQLKVSWNSLPQFTLGKVIDLRIMPKNDAACIYLYHQFLSEKAVELPIALGSDDGMMVWLNNELVISRNVQRDCAAGQDQAVLKVKSGTNRLLVKVCNYDREFGFYLMPQWPPAMAQALTCQLNQDFPPPVKPTIPPPQPPATGKKKKK